LSATFSAKQEGEEEKRERAKGKKRKGRRVKMRSSLLLIFTLRPLF